MCNMYIHVLNLLLVVVNGVVLFGVLQGVQQTLESPGDTKIGFFIEKCTYNQNFIYVA